MAKKEMTYSEKLKDPRWQKVRLKILERDGWTCVKCGDTKTTLHVHHYYYTRGAEPWDYPLDALATLCEKCHQEEYEYRPKCEACLLDILRAHKFLAQDILELAEAIQLVPREVLIDSLKRLYTQQEQPMS